MVAVQEDDLEGQGLRNSGVNVGRQLTISDLFNATLPNDQRSKKDPKLTRFTEI
jgi:hypothetical protein